jgi:3-oxoadipate enol-lactonase
MPLLKRNNKPALHYLVDDYTDPWRDAPYLILQHGNGRSAQFWYRWAPYLARFYKVVRPDVRGLGQSPADFDLEHEFTLDHCVDDLVDLIAALGAKSVHLCGESIGGVLCIALAATRPELVRTLSLVSTPAFINRSAKVTYAAGHASRSDAVDTLGRKAWLEATNSSTRFPPDTDPGLLDWYNSEFLKNNADAQRAMTALVNNANAAPYLPQITAPVLGLYPTGGQITDAEQERTLAANLRNFRVVHLPTSFHKVQLVFAAACATQVLHFIAQHDGVSCHEL